MMLFMHKPQMGEFGAIILLMLQLTSCGGLFPVETSPYFFRVIHDFLPMTFSVKGLRETMMGAYGSILQGCTLILGSIWLVCSTASILIAWKPYNLALSNAVGYVRNKASKRRGIKRLTARRICR